MDPCFRRGDIISFGFPLQMLIGMYFGVNDLMFRPAVVNGNCGARTVALINPYILTLILMRPELGAVHRVEPVDPLKLRWLSHTVGNIDPTVRNRRPAVSI